jgi:transcriptional regulator with XRE-family HTH domain
MPKPMTRSFDDLVTITAHFAEGLDAFLRLDLETQDLIRQLVEDLRDSSVEEDERDAVYSSMAQSLFREAWAEDTSLEYPATEDIVVAQELDREEAVFADRLETLMKERGITQCELAKAVGVSQPAISLMLSRNTRPQRRTVEKLAKALEVEVGMLFPDYSQSETSTALANDKPPIPKSFLESTFIADSKAREFHFAPPIPVSATNSMTEWSLTPTTFVDAGPIAPLRQPLGEAA